MSRIATGNWDAVIVTHSAFGKLKMSKDAQLDFYHAELDQVREAAEEVKGSGGSRSFIKELERQKKRLEKRVNEISNSNKDDGVTFEQLGVDQIYVDEAHYFKNLGYQTKMYGIAGLPNTTSDRAFDLFMKCRYLSQQHGESKGVVFATGTPVSNSMAELYTMQRYLQPQTLKQTGLERFDAWASTFGETVTAPEITPAGGYKVKTRFSRFVNIPELMNTFRQVADIQTAEMLNLPTPQLIGGKPQVVAVGASEAQLAFVEDLARRAENIRNVDPREDNMLLITTDGRKASLDMRLVNPYIPHERNKVDQLVEDAAQFWHQTKTKKTTHLIFCDLGTPKEGADSKNTKEIDIQKHFTVYGYIKEGLIARGVAANEIAFAHDFKTDAKKLEMQQKFNAGKIRVLISGAQLETGFNGQKRLGLESHLTVPWRPDQVEQRDGRILRQGNQNPEVEIRRYVTQGKGGRPSFDSYMWQTLETKKKFTSQVMAGNSEVRTMEDIAGAALTYAEVKAIATGNPLIMEKAEVDNRVSQLAAQKRSHLNQQYSIGREIRELPGRIDGYIRNIDALKVDVQKLPSTSSLTVQNKTFTNVAEAIKLIKALAFQKKAAENTRDELVGQVGGFDLALVWDKWGKRVDLVVRGERDHESHLEHSHAGSASNLLKALSNVQPKLEQAEGRLADAKKRLVELAEHRDAPFSRETELQAALRRQAEINTELGLNQDNAQAGEESDETDIGDEISTNPDEALPEITLADVVVVPEPVVPEQAAEPAMSETGAAILEESLEESATAFVVETEPLPQAVPLPVAAAIEATGGVPPGLVTSPVGAVGVGAESKAEGAATFKGIDPAYPQSPKSEVVIDQAALANATEVLRVAAMAYAYAGSRQQIQQQGESWIAEGKHYDIGYNRVEQSFWVSGKDGSNCRVQALSGAVEGTHQVSLTDLERFQRTETILEGLPFDREQNPAQIQAIAQEQQEAKQSASSTPTLIDEIQAWHRQAKELGRSERHLKQIEQVQAILQQGSGLSDRDLQVMQADKSAWEKQAQSVAATASIILEGIGVQEEESKRFDGKTYQLLLTRSSLSVTASGRGEILRLAGEEIVHSSVTNTDAERFQQFSVQIRLPVKVSVSDAKEYEH